MYNKYDKYIRLISLGIFSERNEILYHVYNETGKYKGYQIDYMSLWYTSRLRLHGTKFEYNPFYYGPSLKPNSWRHKQKGFGWIVCDVDYVMSNISEELQESILFNLDLFT